MLLHSQNGVIVSTNTASLVACATCPCGPFFTECFYCDDWYNQPPGYVPVTPGYFYAKVSGITQTATGEDGHYSHLPGAGTGAYCYDATDFDDPNGTYILQQDSSLPVEDQRWGDTVNDCRWWGYKVDSFSVPIYDDCDYGSVVDTIDHSYLVEMGAYATTDWFFDILAANTYNITQDFVVAFNDQSFDLTHRDCTNVSAYAFTNVNPDPGFANGSVVITITPPM